MYEDDRKTGKDRIIDAAITLFAKKGFAATGVREIAAEADVNIAMISYYFKGKLGILREIIEIYFQNYRNLFADVEDQDLSADDSVKIIIKRIFNFVKENTQLVMVVFNEMPFDVPELMEIKQKYIMEVLGLIGKLSNRFGMDEKSHLQLTIIGPLIISSILTNFRFRPFLGKMLNVKNEQAYDDFYVETLSQLVLYGVHGLGERSMGNGEL